MAKTKAEKFIDSLLSRLSSWPPALWLLAPLSLVILPAYFLKTADNDLFARLAVGKLFYTLGHATILDPFSFAPKNAWYDHEWLAGIVFFLAQKTFADFGLFSVSIIFAALTIYFLNKAQTVGKAPSLVAITLLCCAIFSSAFVWTNIVRAQVFTFLAYAFLLYAMCAVRKANNIKPLRLFPLVMLVWVNAHAGFVVGLGSLAVFVLTLYLEKQQLRHQAGIILLLSIVALWFNPYGIDFLIFVVAAVGKHRPEISEWAPLNFFSPEHLWFHLLTLLAIYSILKQRHLLPSESILLLPLNYYFALRHERLAPFFLFASAVYCLPVAELLLLKLKESIKQLLAGSLAIIFILTSLSATAIVIGSLPQAKSLSLDYSEYPVAPITWIRNNLPPGNLLLHFNEASYAIWAGYPHVKVAVDGRYEELYSEETVQKAMSALTPGEPKQAQLLAELNVDYALLCRSSSYELVDRKYPSDWNNIYNDGTCVIWRKAS